MKEIRKLATKTITVGVSFLGLTLALSSAINASGFPLFQLIGLAGILVLVMISVVFGLVFFISKILETEPGRFGYGKTLAKVVIREVEGCIEKGEYHFAVVLCRAMSRPFYLEGRYQERMRLGELLMRASSSLSPVDDLGMAEALIDDIGWTMVEIYGHNPEKLEDAGKSISAGVEYAKKSSCQYLVAKGYRHLAGIDLANHILDEAIHHLDVAAAEAENILDEHLKREMIAGIAIGRGAALLASNRSEDSKKALACFEEAEVAFRVLKDRERLVKTHSRLGSTYERLGKKPQAIEEYSQALGLAKQIGWPQQICEINLRLGSIMVQDGKPRDAMLFIEETFKIARKLDLREELEEAERLRGRAHAQNE